MGDTVWHSRWGSRIHLAHSYRQGNVFLAGDAAHVHSTAGGQGMNCCMQDACNLGWKLAYVLQGIAPQALLDTYESERKPIGKQVIAAASAIHELFMAGRNNDPGELLALQASGKLQALVGQVSGLDYHYRPEGNNAAGLQAGDRMPDLQLLDGRLYELSRHTRFTLLLASPTVPDSNQRAMLMTLVEKYPNSLQLLELHAAPVQYLNGSAACLYLIRPDGYLALRTKVVDVASLEQWCQVNLRS